MPLVVILVGCKKNAGECKTETDELVKLLRGADRPAFNPYGLTLELKADAITNHGKKVELDGIAESLAEGVKYVPKREKREMGEGTGVVFVRIDDSVPWSRVVEVAGALAANHFDHPTLLASRAPKSTPPPRTAFDDELDKKLGSDDSGGNQATVYAAAVSKLVESCKPLKKVFGAVGSEEGDKAEILLVGMSEALPECSCDVDMPALRSALYRIYQDPHPVEPHKLTLVKTGKPVALPAATPWKDAAKQLPEGETVWLVAN